MAWWAEQGTRKVRHFPITTVSGLSVYPKKREYFKTFSKQLLK